MCEICARSFASRVTLDAHVEIEHGDLDLADGGLLGESGVCYCSLCEKTFAMREDLILHTRSEEHRENEARQAVREIIIANAAAEAELMMVEYGGENDDHEDDDENNCLLSSTH